MSHSLSVQINECRAEIKRRKSDYQRLVSNGKMRRSEAEYHIDVMEGVALTLEWLAHNENRIKQASKAEGAGA